MPEMTPERIATLAQSAKERNPNPGPLDAPDPAQPDRMITVDWTKAGISAIRSHFTGDSVSWEVSHEGDLRITSEDGDAAVFARGSWQQMFSSAMTTEDEPEVETEAARVLTDADVDAITVALSRRPRGLTEGDIQAIVQAMHTSSAHLNAKRGAR